MYFDAVYATANIAERDPVVFNGTTDEAVAFLRSLNSWNGLTVFVGKTQRQMTPQHYVETYGGTR